MKTKRKKGRKRSRMGRREDRRDGEKGRRQREGKGEGERSASDKGVSCNNTIVVVLYPTGKPWG